MRREQAHMLLDTLIDMGERALSRRQVSPEARAHFRTARKETLLGLRSVLDSAIERLHQPDHTTADGGSTKIHIDEN